MSLKPAPLLAALCSLALLSSVVAQRPLTALLPAGTILAVEVELDALDATVLEELFADLETREAARVWEMLEDLFIAGAEEVRSAPERPSTPPQGDRDARLHEMPDDVESMREELAARCPALSGSVDEVVARPWSAAAGVSVSRFDPEPDLLLVMRPGSRAGSAQLLAGAVACFDGRRFGEEGSSVIYLFSDGSEMPLLMAEQGGDLLLASNPDLLRGAIRRAAGSGEPSMADARIASFAQQLEPSGLKVTLDLAAAADALGMVRGVVPPEGMALFERFLTTLRIVGGYAWGFTLDDQGVLLQSVAAWDADLAREAGEDALLAMLACEGCALTPPLLTEGAVAISAGSFPLEAAVRWLDSWLADVSAVALPGDEPRTVAGAVAEIAGVDLDAALLDWFGGSWYSVTLGVLDTDLRNWIMGLPTVTVVPVTSEPAAREGVRLWLEAAVNLDDLTNELVGVAAAFGVGEALSVREQTHAGVDYLRVRAGPTVDMGVAVFDGNLVLGTPAASLLEAIDRRGSRAQAPDALAPGLATLERMEGSLVEYSVTDVGSFLRGLARITELASGTFATTLWLGGTGLVEGELDVRSQDLKLPTYDDALVLTDLAVDALELLAERVGPAVGSTTVRDDARWTTWRLPLAEATR